MDTQLGARQGRRSPTIHRAQGRGRPRAKKARERCVGLSAISSLLQKGDSRVMSLGHPSYPRPKGTRNHSMAEKRGYVEIGETGPRKTRVAWSKLDRLNPNPDRGLSYSVVRPIEHDVIECRPFPFRGYGKPARWGSLVSVLFSTGALKDKRFFFDSFWENWCPAAHNAVGLAGESPAVGIDCLS